MTATKHSPVTTIHGPFTNVQLGVGGGQTLALANDLADGDYQIDASMEADADDHGDDFVFGTSEVPAGDGAGAWPDSEDPALTEWYVEAATGPIGTVTAEDVRRTLDPGHIQHKGPDRPDHAASGDNALTVNEDRRAHRRAREEASED